MTTTTTGGAGIQIEAKPGQPASAERGAAMLAQRIEEGHEWGVSAQATLTGMLADLIAAAGEDPDLSFGDALAAAWHRLD